MVGNDGVALRCISETTVKKTTGSYVPQELMSEKSAGRLNHGRSNSEYFIALVK